MVELVLRWCVLVPTAVTLAFLLPTLRPWRRCVEISRAAGWLMPLGLALAYALTHLGLREDWRLTFPPADVKLYLVYFLPVVALVGAFVFSAGSSRWWVRILAATVLFGGYFPLLLARMLTANSSLAGVMGWLVGLPVGAGILSWVLDTVGRELPSRLWMFLLGLYVVLSAGLFGLMGSLTSGEQLGGAATFLGILFLLLLWKRGESSSCGLGFVVVFLLVGNACEVYFFSYAVAPMVPLLIWLSVPLLWWLVLRLGGKKFAAGRAWIRWLVLLLVVFLPMLSAGIVVYRANAADATGSENEYQYEMFE